MNRSIRKSIGVNEIDYLLKLNEVPEDKCARLKPALFEDPRSDRVFLLKEEIKTLDDLKTIIDGIVEEQIIVESIVNGFAVFEDLKIPEGIRDAFLGTDKIAFFIGAGVSRLLGIPLWEALAKDVISYLNDKNLINKAEADYLKNDVVSPRQIISIFHQIVKDKYEREAFYKDKLKRDDKDRENPYELLFKFENAIAKPITKITTNIDSEWQNLLRAKEDDRLRDKDEQGTIKNPKVLFEGIMDSRFKKGIRVNDKVLYHIHGSFNKFDEAVLTTGNYVHHYNDDEGLKGFLSDVFKSHTVIFLGSGMQEFEILVHCLENSSSQHYALVGTGLGQENLFRIKKAYFSNIKVKAIPYYLDFQGYERLTILLNSWIKEITLLKSQQFYEGIQRIDEVL